MRDSPQSSCLHVLGFSRWNPNDRRIWVDRTAASDNDPRAIPVFSLSTWTICETILRCCCAIQWSRIFRSYSIFAFSVHSDRLAQVMISPFVFPVTAETFNFVSILYACIDVQRSLETLGLRDLWNGHNPRCPFVVPHAGG